MTTTVDHLFGYFIVEFVAVSRAMAGCCNIFEQMSNHSFDRATVVIIIMTIIDHHTTIFLNLAKIYFAQAPVENAPPAKSLISNFYICRRRLLEITRLRNIEFRIFIFVLGVKNQLPASDKNKNHYFGIFCKSVPLICPQGPTFLIFCKRVPLICPQGPTFSKK